MKKKVIYLLVFFVAVNVNVIAQNCDFYFPLNEGSELITKSYDKKDNLTGWSKQTIKKKENLSNGTSITMLVESYDTKEDTAISKTELKYECRDNIIYVDMNAFINQASFAAYKDMEVKVTTKDMTFPAELKVNDVLDNGNIEIKVSSQGTQILTSVVSITNRKVLAIESVTTPAGTFECYKITSDIESKMIFTVKTTIVEWYAKEVGSVRSENYDKTGKLVSYSVLEGLTKK